MSSPDRLAPTGGGSASAAAVAQAWVMTRPAQLRVGPGDGFVQHATITSAGWSYVPYDRTYRGLPVVGGDFVVVIDPAGRVQTASVAQPRPIVGVAIPASVTAQAAKWTAAGDGRQLVVYARSGQPLLAWQATNAAGVTTYADVASGAVLERRGNFADGFGYSGRNGPNPVFIATRHVHFSIYDRYYLIDPSNNGISCGDKAVGQPFMQTIDTWGNGDPTNRVTGCVDAMFAQQKFTQMLAQRLGRNGVDGAGHGFPMWLDANIISNAYWTGSSAVFGLHKDNTDPPRLRWITSLDVVGHELGHAVDQFTPGGLSAHSTREFIGDVFATANEWYANEPSGFDTPDFIEADGYPDIERRMFGPNEPFIPRCYKPGIETVEDHYAAAIGDHWFYLLAEGTNPTDGNPPSSTCNTTRVVTGVGIQVATRILYNAMLMKTSNSLYPAYRLWTLQAAFNLYGCNGGIVNRVRTAWDAILVPVQPNEPLCGISIG